MEELHRTANAHFEFEKLSVDRTLSWLCIESNPTSQIQVNKRIMNKLELSGKSYLAQIGPDPILVENTLIRMELDLVFILIFQNDSFI